MNAERRGLVDWFLKNLLPLVFRIERAVGLSKVWYLYTKTNGVTPQKTVFLTLFAHRTSKFIESLFNKYGTL